MNIQYRLLAFQSLLDLFNHQPLPMDFVNYPPAAKNLILQTCRHYHQLEQIALFLMNKKSKDLEVWVIIILGLCELHILEKPEHAVIHEMVNLIKKSRHRSAAGLTNAILRKSIREKTRWQKHFETHEVFQYSHPQWLIDIIKQAWPDNWSPILKNNNIHPPMTLRINASKIKREKYLENIEDGHSCQYAPQGLFLNEATPVKNLYGFSEGYISIQDEAAQLAAELLNIEKSHRVLDACAAPGGKTSHILEAFAPKECVAIELQEKRFQNLHHTLQRLGLTAHCIQADASAPETWWDGQLFDRILIDAPCSGTGVIRRHPDIKLRRQMNTLFINLNMQKKLLETLWPLLKPNGLLLYATCSILPEENEQQIENFLALHPDAKSQEINLLPGKKLKHGLQIFPGTANMDGFYYCLIRKI